MTSDDKKILTEESGGVWTRLRELVDASGRDLEDLARDAGMSSSALADLLQAEGRSPGFEAIFVVLGVLGEEPGEFFGRLYGLRSLRVPPARLDQG